MFKYSLMSLIIRACIMTCTVAFAGSAFVPAVAGARSVTADDVKVIKDRLIRASTMEELVSALQDAKSAGMPWQDLYESAVYYTIRTGDYSLADALMANFDRFAKEFRVEDSLLCGSRTDASILMHVFIACVALHNGDRETAVESLRQARALDPETLDDFVLRARTIQEDLNA
jgi:hypothetical protein